MRDFLDGILTFILAEALTDEEFDTVEASVPVLDQATYDDLSRILASREDVTDAQSRLSGYYKAKGVNVSDAETGKSNIFLGGPL